MSSTRENDKRQMCSECGMAVDPVEYHPYAFCVLHKAELDPWDFVLTLNEDLGLVPQESMPARPPDMREVWASKVRKVEVDA